jgi:hypothetical protein
MMPNDPLASKHRFANGLDASPYSESPIPVAHITPRGGNFARLGVRTYTAASAGRAGMTSPACTSELRLLRILLAFLCSLQTRRAGF